MYQYQCSRLLYRGDIGNEHPLDGLDRKSDFLFSNFPCHLIKFASLHSKRENKHHMHLKIMQYHYTRVF